MDELPDFYAILGVPRDVPEIEIRRAFRAKAKKLHPDSNIAAESNPDISEEFRLLTEAYDTLKDPARRKAYDLELSRQRQLAAPAEARQGRAFAKGLAAGLLLAIAAVGAKIYLDRLPSKGAGSKNQESLRPVNPPVAEVANQSSRGGEPIDGLSAIVPAPAAPDPTEKAALPKTPGGDRAFATGSSSYGPRPLDGAGEPDGETASGQAIQEGAAGGPHQASDALQPAGGQSIAIKQPQTPAGTFASSIISLENELNAGGGDSIAAYRLVSLVNSSNTLDELTAGAAVAKRAETQNLINGRIAALKAQPDAASEPSQALQSVPAKPRPKPGTLEVAIGPTMREIYLTPGAGLSEGFSDCPGCPEMAVIPAGLAIIGSRPETTGFRPEEAPAHKTSIRKPLAISKHWITAGEWRVCVEAGDCRPTLSSFLAAGSQVPVTRVSWFDAKAYVDWISRISGHSYRLLSEAEWEYAAQAQGHRAPETTLQPNPAGTRPSPDFGFLRFGGRLRHLGASKANGWGLYAIPGGVLEWVEDCWHQNYNQAPSDGSAWLASGGGDCSYRVVRGGLSTGAEPEERRVAARAREFTDARSPALGFRVARDLAPPAKPAPAGAAKTAAGN